MYTNTGLILSALMILSLVHTHLIYWKEKRSQGISKFTYADIQVELLRCITSNMKLLTFSHTKHYVMAGASPPRVCAVVCYCVRILCGFEFQG